MGQAPAFGFLHHGIGHGVGEMFLQTGGQPQHLPFILTTEGDHLCHLGASMGQGAGLVKYNGISSGYCLQEFALISQQ